MLNQLNYHCDCHFRDPRQKRLLKEQEAKRAEGTKRQDGAQLSFKEKMRLFALEAGESSPRDKTKVSGGKFPQYLYHDRTMRIYYIQ